MPAEPPGSSQPPLTQQDQQFLKLVEIFHYVLAAMIAVTSCFPIFHFAMGIFMLVAGDEIAEQNSVHVTTIVGGLFTAIAGAMMLFGWVLAFLIYLGGRNIAQHRRRMFCLVVAGLSCLFMPFGTALGVFTIIVLMRPSVEALFDNASDGQDACQA